MSNKITSFNYLDGLKILLAVITFGIGWLADNQVTVVAYAAVLIVSLIGFIARQYPQLDWLKGKAPLTVAVFVVSFILAYFFKPFTFPVFPGWTGDAGTYVPLISSWLEAFFAIVGTAVAFSMSIYNVLLSQVLEKLPALSNQTFGSQLKLK